jgi:small subunit ribosomal protein S2
MSEKIHLKKLIEAGLHFGHQRYRWSPKMKPYIWGHRNGIHLIDISKTAQALEKACKFLKEIASENKQILWVGTKKVASKFIADTANSLDMPYVDYRWVGGMLTNYSQVKKSVTKLLHFEDILLKSEETHFTKKELNHYSKVKDRLGKSVGGIKKLNWPVGAVVIIDAKKEATALREAAQCGIPVVALVDTNSDPSNVDFVIPGNDDSTKSVSLVIEMLRDAAKSGREQAEEIKAAKKAEKELAAAEKKQADIAVKAKAKVKAEVKFEAKPLVAKKVAVAPKKEAAPAKEVKAEVKKEDAKPAK